MIEEFCDVKILTREKEKKEKERKDQNAVLLLFIQKGSLPSGAEYLL